MIKLILWLIGLGIIVFSVVILIKPQLTESLSGYMNETTFAIGSWVRIAIGLFFLLIADTHQWSLLFDLLGALLVVVGAYQLHRGYDYARSLVDKIVHSNKNIIRALAVFGALVGILLISAS